ncbi:sulfurtransferase [Geomonas sp. RF6]|uniref:sulfurtransferase n=1 Tax=Geomonas sp. RF6 TaxID=2897342 RepID=UPI001E3000DE|nr:sulfurtransferase [Geomonas sp. RF6]UFS70340.1 sulfurtransferase [Geomonas sp. RF6]
MPFETIISCEEAAKHLGDGGWVFIDCRFQLADKEQGHKEYLANHIENAVYADLEKDLSGEVVPLLTGRHPLPHKDAVARTFSRLGISSDSQVVAYDYQAGQMAAARLWWLLKWAGHAAVAVLDGGYQRWTSLGLSVESGSRTNERGDFSPRFNDGLVVVAEDVMERIGDPSTVIVDARASDRFRGENETIDPVAGHIPGAISAPFVDNIAPDGKLKTAEELRRQFEVKTGETPAEKTIFYCGSGVTAAQSILSFVHCGNRMPRLYSGSWSDWITKGDRPVAAGE